MAPATAAARARASAPELERLDRTAWCRSDPAQGSEPSGQGTSRSSALGTISYTTGVVPGCSPSSSAGSVRTGVISTRRARSSSTFAVTAERAAVEPVQVEDEVDLRDVADQDHVEHPVVRGGSKARSSCRRRSSGSSRRRRCSRPASARCRRPGRGTRRSASRGTSPTVAHRNAGVPPSRFEVALARSATAPVMPQEAMFANIRMLGPAGGGAGGPAEVDPVAAAGGDGGDGAIESASGSRRCG